ncbi:MAG: hypothetical protein MZV64_64585 [Ignavibacteriales bacterium]|nr:hypothetical protein [Ignavibacteriales bacterium]
MGLQRRSEDIPSNKRIAADARRMIRPSPDAIAGPFPRTSWSQSVPWAMSTRVLAGRPGVLGCGMRRTVPGGDGPSERSAKSETAGVDMIFWPRRDPTDGRTGARGASPSGTTRNSDRPTTTAGPAKRPSMRSAGRRPIFLAGRGRRGAGAQEKEARP